MRTDVPLGAAAAGDGALRTVGAGRAATIAVRAIIAGTGGAGRCLRGGAAPGLGGPGRPGDPGRRGCGAAAQTDRVRERYDAHLDIAGPFILEKKWKYYAEGATGFGVKTFVALAESM